jgi:hypothetical protein
MGEHAPGVANAAAAPSAAVAAATAARKKLAAAAPHATVAANLSKKQQQHHCQQTHLPQQLLKQQQCGACALQLRKRQPQWQQAVAAGSVETVTSPSLPATPAKHKQQCSQPDNPSGGLEEATEACQHAILQLNSDNSICSDSASEPRSLLQPPQPPDDPATVKNLCCLCNTNNIFNYDLRKCQDCLKKLIFMGIRYHSSSSEYNLKHIRTIMIIVTL